MKPALFFLPLVVVSSSSEAATAIFLGNEYQSQSGANAGSCRTGDPASDPAFSSFLGTASLVNADVIVGETASASANGIYATWGKIVNNQAAINLGSTVASISIGGWRTSANSPFTPTTGAATLMWGYNNSTALQSGAPRPGFASGAGSGYGVYTDGGASNDGIRNAVVFSLSTPISAFGIFGGDLETGGPAGSPSGLLYIEFSNGETQIINYTPDPSLFPDATFSITGNNDSETYGNETGRFIGISDDTRLITRVTFVVGEDDRADNGDSEQLSFIAPITFSKVLNGTVTPFVPTNLPEPGVPILALTGLALSLRRSRQGASSS